MPAINVAKTDTFEVQRQKINQIGNQIFNISQGGSDLSTGNLKLGDGTRTTPSLAFISDSFLGIYKPDEKTIGYVSDGRKIADFAPAGFYSFRDLIIQRKILSNSGISINNFGENYDAGTYSDIQVLGGTGEGALASIQVIEYDGTITNSGENYIEGNYTNVELSDGSGSGAISSFTIEGINGDITSAGTGYVPGTYTNVLLTNGTGTGATADLVITGNTVLTGVITNSGSSYSTGTYSQVELLNVPTTTYAVTVVSNPGTPPPDNVYQINGNTQQALTLIKGNTYRFDISDSSVDGHPFVIQTTSGNALNPDYYVVTSRGSAGTANSFVDLIIKPTAPTETIKYNCSVHDGMGANISVVSGSTGNYGNGVIATITVNGSNEISNVEFTNSGFGYKLNDTLQVYSSSVGGTGSGFVYTLNQPSYTGEVTSVSIQSNGVDYLKNDILFVSNSSVGGFGSGFQYTITSDPGIIKNFSFTDRGNGYLVNDLLSLPSPVTGVSTNLKGEVLGVTTTLSTSSPIITVSSTDGIVEGMNVIVTSFDPFNPGASGNLESQTTVLSVDSNTQLTLSTNPSVDGPSTLTFRSPGILTEIVVSSTTGIFPGYLVSQTSGTGVIASNTTVTSINAETNVIQLSQDPDLAGSAVLSFLPPFGSGTQQFEYEIEKLGVVDSFNITNGGNGYSVSDQLTVNSTDLVQPITYNVINRSLQRITFSSVVPSATFSQGDVIKVADGSITSFIETSTPSITPSQVGPLSSTLSDSSAIVSVSSTSGIEEGMIVSQVLSDTGQLSPETTVLSVDSLTQITLSEIPITSGSANLSFVSDESGTFTNISTTSDNNGINATVNVFRDSDGTISAININDGGVFYQEDDTITIDGSLIGGISSSDDIILTVTGTSENPSSIIRQKILSGGNIESLLVDFVNFQNSDLIIKENTSTVYELDNVSSLEYKFFIDLNDGNGYQLTPDITLYSGSTYTFDLSDSSNNGHIFSLSEYKDGIWGPSYIQNVSTTLSTNTNIITVANTTGILPGMIVEVESGDGVLLANTKVLSVTPSNVTLSNPASTSGSVIVNFRGVEYTEAVTRTDDSLSIKVLDSTPNLYYYCSTSEQHQNEGGDDNVESLITTDNNNPKIFGSGFLSTVLEVSSSDVIKGNIATGELEAIKIITDEGEISNLTISSSLNASSIVGSSIFLSTITSSNLSVSSPTTSFSGNLNIGSGIQINAINGNITTNGIIKTTQSLNINDILTISNNTISASSGNNILLSPPTGRITKIVSTGALTIPSGTTAQRPPSNIVENGSIRFNTQTNQYEGYSGATSSWSSLGGVRDLDGNTYITAEESIGSNDNRLWFYNDNINTVRFTPQYQEFVNVKKIRSLNVSAPQNTNWSSNTQVIAGQYLKYLNNIYEVIVSGTTGTSGNEPIDTTGNIFTNGTSTLRYFTTAVAPLTFEEITELKIAPLGGTSLSINDDLRLSENIISTDVNDLIIRPNTGKKVTIDANTSLVLPVGDSNERGAPIQGSVRFNNTISQYEGYDGTNWSSLGGVRDVDGNTYIIPELSAGSNENILYFYNNGSNTLRVTENDIQLDLIDTFESQTSNNINLNAQLITFNNLAASIDTSGPNTFITTTQGNLDLGLASGLANDPLLRLSDTGDIYYNLGFGSGVYNGVKIFDSELKELEIADFKISTTKVTLTRNTVNTGSAVLYDPTLHESAKVQIIAHNTITGNKEFVEYSVIDNGTDIFFTDFGNVKTGSELISCVFDFNANNNVRVTFTLDNSVVSGNTIEVTVISNIIKR